MANTTWVGVRTEGALLPADFLQRLSAGSKDIGGLQPAAFGLEPGEKINEAASRAWTRLQGAWETFQRATVALPTDDPATSATREKWLLPLFDALGFGRLATAKAIDVGGKSFAISHSWGAVPIHLVGRNVDLDRRTAHVAGAAKSSPHGLVQELLNASPDHQWGIVSNGLRLRLLRDNRSMTRQAFVEFDLLDIMDGQAYSDFVLVFLLLHVSRFAAEKPEECWLEKWTRTAQEEGTSALKRLREGVEKAIKALGSGFLGFGNPELKARLRSGALDKNEYFRQLLRLVYRLLFLFVAEDRGLLHPTGASETARRRYAEHYSTRRLRRIAGKRRGTAHGDLWESLRFVMSRLGDPEGCPELALPALGSYLWRDGDAVPDLCDARLANADLLEAIRHLAFLLDGRVRRAVDFRNLGPEELGGVYEALLELHPEIHAEAGTFELNTAAGHERKTTGSYYTPSSLISCLLDSALDPVLDGACKKPDPAAAILDLKVVDPACGSGHFLIAAAHRMANRLAAVRTGEAEPPPEAVRTALRDVIGRCIHGVDLNPMAAELCKINLWLDALEPGRPFSFLDHHIQVGNSLLGTTPALLRAGVPDDAFDPIEGDEKDVARSLKKQNKAERQKQSTLFAAFAEGAAGGGAGATLQTAAAGVEAKADDTVAAVEAKAGAWDALLGSDDYRRAKLAADAWCAAFVWPKSKAMAGVPAPTFDLVRRAIADAAAVPQPTRREVERLAAEHGFLHWHLAFPRVFGEAAAADEGAEAKGPGWTGGFDVVLGNPPWDQVQLDDSEFFAESRPDIAGAATTSKRKAAIKALRTQDPSLFAAYLQEARSLDFLKSFVHLSGRFPLTSFGRLNLAPLFVELNCFILSSRGRAGAIAPSGIAFDSFNQYFFRDIVDRGTLVSLFDFENRLGLFPAVHRSYRYCLLTVSGPANAQQRAQFTFFAGGPGDLADRNRRFFLSTQDLALFNPNTRTCPTFRTLRDAEITRGVYSRVPVLLLDHTPPRTGTWGFAGLLMFMMNTDSGLFRSRGELLEDLPSTLAGSAGRRHDYLPLYEAKMVHHFTHRFGDYADKAADSESTALPDVPDARLADPGYVPRPRYWVAAAEVAGRLAGRWDRGWLLGWRDICRSTDERTVIPAVIPRVGVGNQFPLMLFDRPDLGGHLAANLSAFVLDFVARQKVGGTHLNFFIYKQLPVLPPAAYGPRTPWHEHSSLATWLQPRVLELTYTAWDLRPFARDLGWDGVPFRWDPGRRFKLRCELDAAFFHLYGIARDDVDYIMDTFPIVREKDEKRHGDYSTKLQILALYDAMQKAIDTGTPYQTILDPPPADPSVAHTTPPPDWAP